MNPLVTKPVHYEPVEKRTLKAFREIIFRPLVQIIQGVTSQPMQLKNTAAEESLRVALRSGRVQYQDGVFSGQFNSHIAIALRTMGAKLQRNGTYKIDQAIVPPYVLADSVTYQSDAKSATQKMEDKLNEIQQNLDSLIDKHPVIVDDVIGRVVGDFKGIAKELEIPPTLSQESIDKMSTDYTNNMKLWIKKWSEEEIVKLREVVEDNATQGYRFDKLIAEIQQRYSVTKSKAQFLARQETALFVSKFQENRFKEAGIESYVWSTSHDERVRDSHKDLDGKTFFWNNPPIIPGTSRHAAPGEDYNCRCVAIPVL